MSLILTDDQNYKDIASAIRSKSKSEDTYKPNEMAEAIEKINTMDYSYVAPVESAVKNTKSGTGLVSLDNTVEWYMQGLKLYGRSWQNGTPSVETEVPIEDVGQSGQVDVTVCGENLFNPNGAYQFASGEMREGITATILADGSIKFDGINTGNNNSDFYFEKAQFAALQNGHYVLQIFANDENTKKNASIFYNATNGFFQGYNGAPCVFEAKKGASIGYVIIRLSKNVNFNGFIVKVSLVAGENAAESFSPYTAPQQLPIPTPNGLPGIPVDSGGNWTDENGQQWVSDVVDLAAGTKTQNLAHESLTLSFQSMGTYTRYIGTLNRQPNSDMAKYSVSNILQYNAAAGAQDGQTGFRIAGNLVIAKSGDTVLESIDIVYPIATPITTPLDAETIAAYKDLQSYPGATNIFVSDCGIEASAYEDAKNRIDGQKIQETSILDRTISGDYENDLITSIGDSAFKGCSKIQNIKMINLQSVSNSAFFQCTALETVYFPKVENVGSQSFFNCPSAKIFYFGKLRLINAQAFQDLKDSAIVIIDSETVCSLLSANCFQGFSGYIYVKDELLEQYKVATNWSSITNQLKGRSELSQEIKDWIGK